MNEAGLRSQYLPARFQNIHLRRGLLFGGLILAALIAFEIFNYSTTEFALENLLGELKFFGVSWATILAIAFCGIDFAGIARLFTPEEGENEPAEIWYLFGAWMLAATMNAMLTWWGVSLALLNHQTLGNAVIERETLVRVVPIFVAIMVWLIRVLIIGTFSVAGERLFSQMDDRDVRARQITSRPRMTAPASRALGSGRPINRPTATGVSRPAVQSPAYRPAPQSFEPAENSTPRYEPRDRHERIERPEPKNQRPEPTYHPVSMRPHNGGGNRSVRR